MRPDLLAILAAALFGAAACQTIGNDWGDPAGDDGGELGDDGSGGGGDRLPGRRDADGDGYYSIEECDDSQAMVNPGAFEVAGNGLDDDCDGEVDEEAPTCDCGDGSLPAGLELCDSRFLLGWDEVYSAPNGAGAAAVRDRYGDAGNGLAVQRGCGYTVISTGFVDVEDCDPVWDCPNGKRQPGTDLWYQGDRYCEEIGSEPDPSPDGGGGTMVCDTHQLVLRLRAPTNAIGFSFDFIYLSTEYPEYIDAGYNDTFYAIVDRPSVGERRNISFDEGGNEIEVDNAFFEDPPRTDLRGSGYDGQCLGEFRTDVCGSSTGWLRTSWAVNPGEEFTLTFSIHDEGDGVLDSAVILDNFAWSAAPVEDGTDVLY